MKPCVHFVAIRGERIAYATRIFGPPDFIHPGWDKRAKREIADCDIVIFGRGTFEDEPRWHSYQDQEPE